MTPQLQKMAGSIKKAVQLASNPLFFPEQNWKKYEPPAIERLKGVDLRQWHAANTREAKSASGQTRSSLDQLI